MPHAMHLEAVFLPDCGMDAIRDAFSALGGRFVHRFTKDESMFEEEIWELDGGSTAIRTIADDFMGVTIVRAESDLDHQVPALLGELGELVPIIDADGLLDLAVAEDPATRSFGLRGLAAITAHFDTNVFELIAEAAADPDPVVRRLALRCMARYPWAPFAMRLDAIAGTETEPALVAEQRAVSFDLRERGLRLA